MQGIDNTNAASEAQVPAEENKPLLTVAPNEPVENPISIEQQIDLPPPIIQVGNTNPEIINNIASTAEVASNGKVNKEVTAAAVQNYGAQSVRDQFATQQSLGKENYYMDKADKSATAGNVTATEDNVRKAQEAKNFKNDGALEQGAVHSLTKNKTDIPSATKTIAWRKQYIQNKVTELHNQYEQESFGKKAGEFLLNAFPLAFNIAVSGTGEQGKTEHLSDIFSPQEFAASNLQNLLNPNISDEEFVKRFDQMQKNIAEKSAFLGANNLSLQIQVYDAMLESANADRVMDKIFTAVDVAGVGQSVGAGLKTAAKGLRGTKKVVEEVAKGTSDPVSSGALSNTAKVVGAQDQVAIKAVQSVNGNEANNMINSVSAAHKNMAPLHEPNYVKDSTSVQALNLNEVIDGVGSKLEMYKEDRKIAEFAKILKDVQQNRALSEDELAEAVSKAQLKYGNDTINLKAVAEHDFDDKTLMPVVKTRITQNSGEGWATEKQALDYFNENFKTDKGVSVVQDVNGRYVVNVENTLDDLLSFKDIEVKEGWLQRIINNIYYGHKNQKKTGSALSVVQPMDYLPSEVQSAGMSALTQNRQLIKLKDDIFKQNIVKLGGKQGRGITKLAMHYLEKEGYEWPSLEEAADQFRILNGYEPDENILKSWMDYKQLNDMDWTMSNLYHRNLLKDRGFVHAEFKTSNPELVNPIAKPLDKFSDFDDAPYIYDVENGQFRTIDDESYFDMLKDQGYKFYKIYDYAKVTGPTGKLERIKYVLAKNPGENELPHSVLPYRAGGRVQYAGQWFVKQPNVQKVTIKGVERDVIHPPITHVISESRLEAEKFAERTNAALREYKKIQTVVKQGKQPSLESMKKLGELWAKTRWGSLESFLKDVEQGKATLHEFETLADRQKLKMGEKYAKESTGRMADEDHDIEMLFNIARRGERKLDATGQPAKLVSPFLSLDAALSRDVKKLTFQRFVNDAARRFHKTFKDDLTETYANPVNAIIHGEFKRAVDPNRIAIGTRYQAWLRNLAKIGYTADEREMDEMGKMFSQYEKAIEDADTYFDKTIARTKFGVYKWWKTAEPGHFFRGLMFKTTFGFYNFKQLLTQSNTAFIIFGSAFLRNPADGIRSLHDLALMPYILARATKRDAKYLDELTAKAGTTGSKATELLRDYHDAGIVNVQRFFGQPDIQDYTKGLPKTIEKSSDLLRQAKLKTQKLSDSGDIFYNIGTQVGNYAGFVQARYNLLKKYGPSVLSPESKNRAKYLKDLRMETERLSFGQSSANNLTIQRAHTDFGARGLLVEMGTQYMQYNLKLIQAILPKALGGSKSYSAIEKASMFGTIAGLSGTAALPFQNWISSEMYLEFREKGWFEGTPQEWFESWWNQGFLNEVVNSIFDLKGDQLSSFGQQLSPWGQTEDMLGMLFGNKPLSGYVGGPMLNKVVNVFNQVAQYDDLQRTMAGKNDGNIGAYGLGALIAAIQGGVSTAGSIGRLSKALSSDNVLTKKGYAIAKSNDTAAWLNFIGITTNPYEVLEFQTDLMNTFEKDISAHEAITRNLIVQRTQALNEGRFDDAAQITQAIGIQMNFIPPQERARFYSGTFKNFNHPVLEYQRQQIAQKLAFLDARNNSEGYGE